MKIKHDCALARNDYREIKYHYLLKNTHIHVLIFFRKWGNFQLKILIWKLMKVLHLESYIRRQCGSDLVANNSLSVELPCV